MNSMVENKVYFIIINWNGLNDTIECIDSIQKNTIADHQIVLVDNASDNNEARTLEKKFDHIKVIRKSKNSGFCKANNTGLMYALAQADCTHIFILNNDANLLAGSLENLIAQCDKTPNCLISPIVLYYNSHIIQNAGGKISYTFGFTKNIGTGKILQEKMNLSEPDYLVGCAIFAPKNTIEKCGLLDESFFAFYEDTAYSFTAKKRGVSLSICTDAVIYHKHSNSFGRMGNLKAYLLARNSLLFAKKYLTGYPKINFMISCPIFYFVLAIIRGKKLESVIYVLQGIYDAAINQRRYP